MRMKLNSLEPGLKNYISSVQVTALMLWQGFFVLFSKAGLSKYPEQQGANSEK